MSALPLAQTDRHVVALSAEDDIAGWRSAARAALAYGVRPEDVEWRIAGRDDLFGGVETTLLAPAGTAPAITISRDLWGQMKSALLHSDPGRFTLAYRILWRRQAERHLDGNPADPDMIRLRRLAKEVRRDIHKMHAFVRFRKVGETDGRECFAAWFEPFHHIVRATGPFFRDRFAGMNWVIVTPEATIGWDGETLHDGPGGKRSDVPAEDAVEAEWRRYYASIFNPARLMTRAMKKEMPVKYWNNLPEAPLIDGLIRDAGKRTATMIDTARPPVSAAPVGGRPDMSEFGTLADLDRWAKAHDAAPSDGFSARIVSGEGDPHARIVLVGEQPGDVEDEQGRVFVGPAGRMLDAALKEAGIDRGRCYLTNAVKRFKFQQRGKRRLHQTPTQGDVTHYRWWLAEELQLVKPQVTVALGATAVLGLTGKKLPIAANRGDPIDYGEGRLLITAHPSFILRQREEEGRDIEYAKLVRDLKTAAALSGDS